MRISVAMAAYNGAPYIREQLESFSCQTARPDELVVCDDGSTDATVSILEDFGRSAPFEVRIFRNGENLGYGQNFAKALGLCTGDLIFLSDQDDFWLPDKIATIRELAAGKPEILMWMNDSEMADDKLVPSGLTVLGQIGNARLKPESFVHGCCSAVRRELLQLALPMPADQFGHDSWLVELAESLDARRIHPKALQLYRIHGRNTSGYFLNTPGRIGLFGKLKHRFSSIGAQQMKEEVIAEMDKLAALECRVKAELRSPGSPGMDSHRLHQALMRLSVKRAAFWRRMEMFEMPKLNRTFTSLSMLLGGDYRRHFNGYQSFLRDLLLLVRAG